MTLGFPGSCLSSGSCQDCSALSPSPRACQEPQAWGQLGLGHREAGEGAVTLGQLGRGAGSVAEPLSLLPPTGSSWGILAGWLGAPRCRGRGGKGGIDPCFVPNSREMGAPKHLRKAGNIFQCSQLLMLGSLPGYLGSGGQQKCPGCRRRGSVPGWGVQ